MDSTVFFTVHRDLPREGPGLPDDVHWALEQVPQPPERVLDAACGPGADLVTLAEALPDAQVLGVEKQVHFIADAQARVARFGRRVQVRQGDMFHVGGPFDLIWCAGAVYFAGVTRALELWAHPLARNGAIAFSEPVLPEGAGKAAWGFWGEEYPQVTDAAGIDAQVRAAGFRTIATRLIIGRAWEAYYRPMEARIAALRAEGASEEVEKACAVHEAEIAAWKAAQDEVAYLLSVVRPA